MPVIVTSEELKQLVDAKKGKEVINILSGISPASSMITLCVALASIVPAVCETQKDAEFTLDELGRLMKSLADAVYKARASGELKTQPLKWDDAKWGD